MRADTGKLSIDPKLRVRLMSYYYQLMYTSMVFFYFIRAVFF